MKELASFTIITNTDLVVVELGAELGHVVRLNVFLFEQLILVVGVRAIITKLAFTKVNDVLAHFGLPLHLHSLVELLSLLWVGEVLLLLLPCGLTIGTVFFHGI